jgi:4-amino-4-deoxy-L-arabinose transferase-like glycosyltransferase
LFVITVFSIFGRSFTILALILLLIDSTVPVILYRAGERWRSWKVGAAAGLLYAVSLLCVISCQHILTDSLFTFFVSLQILFYIRFFKEGRTRDLVIMVIILGIITMIRPTASNWIFILLALLLLKRPLPGNRRLSRLIITAIIFAAICAPWITRSVRGGAGFRLVTIYAKGVRYNFAPAVEAEVTGRPAGEIRAELRDSDELLFESNPELFPDEDSRYRYRMDKGLETIKRHPVVFMKLCARPYVFFPAVDAFYEHIGITAGGKGTLDILTRKGPIAAVRHYFGGKTWLILPVLPWILILGVTYLACARGLFLCIRERAWGDLLSFAFFAIYFLAIIGSNTLSRYRLPAMPAIVLMAALGITSWKRSAENR